MADIAQGYIHLKPYGLSRDPEVVGDLILEEAKRVATSIYSFPLRLDVRLEEGSLRVWVGVVAALYPAIAAYPDFKEGVKELYSDAKAFGSMVIERTTEELKPSEDQIFRRERRTMISGKLLRLTDRIAQLEKYMKAVGDAKIGSQIRAIEDELLEIVRHLDTKDAAAVAEFVVIPKGSGAEPPRLVHSNKRYQQLDMLMKSRNFDSSANDRNLLYDRSEFLNLDRPVETTMSEIR